MKTIVALTLHFRAPAIYLGLVSERDLKISRTALAAGLVDKPWARALRLIGSGRRSVRLAAVAFGLMSAATAQAGSFDVETKLTASDAAGGDRFGISVGISGNTAIAGADLDDDAGDGSGSAYLFDVTAGNQLFKLTAADAAAGDQFGISVGISGNTAIVGAVGDDDAGNNSGSAYLFTPEPSSLLLAGLACLALLVWRKRCRSGFRA